jgi:dihydrofolate reductase
MGRLLYSAIASLDGYVEDQAGNFDWAAPDEDVHRFLNDLERPVGTYLYGRRMYETMLYWDSVLVTAKEPAVVRDFTAIWRAAEKIVYSRTLESVSSERTRIERDFDAETVRHLKASSEQDLTVGGSSLAAEALRAGLVDELQLFLVPALVGGGKHWLPRGVRLDLDLLATRRFPGGVVYLRYRPRASPSP